MKVRKALKREEIMTVAQVVRYFREHSWVRSPRQIRRIRNRLGFPPNVSMPGCHPTYEKAAVVAYVAGRKWKGVK
jgi:hypothetical protein